MALAYTYLYTSAMAALFFTLFAFLWLAIMGLIIASFVLWIVMLIDAIKRKFGSDELQILWIAVIIAGGSVGAIVYYFGVRRPLGKVV